LSKSWETKFDSESKPTREFQFIAKKFGLRSTEGNGRHETFLHHLSVRARRARGMDKDFKLRTEVIGSCTLYLGDCRSVLPTLPAGTIECVVTSPPYNTLALKGEPSGMWAETHGCRGFVERFKSDGYADDRPEDEYQNEQLEIFSLAAKACTDTGSLFYNHKIRWRDGVCLHPIQWFQPKGWTLRQEIIWDRGGGVMHNARMFCLYDERIIWLDKGRHKWNQSTGFGSIWKITQMDAGRGKIHPVQFPEQLPLRCISATTSTGDTVLDPFMGSATTGAVCVQLDRKFIGIEREPKYFDIACKRISQAYSDQALFADLPKEPTYEQQGLF
jgi:site-specific DNA-methyltransferase (adenine-specific)